MKLERSLQDTNQRLLASLRYSEMNERWNAVQESHQGTYEWIFDETIESSWSPFVPFLVGNEPLYWVQGNPGSGKSSLMKLMCSDPRTRNALERAHPGRRPSMIKFFFWLAGVPIQRSLKGLWCSLLFQMLNENQGSIHEIKVRFPTLSHKENIGDWSLKELDEVFACVVRLVSRPLCVFLDGLDELDPDLGPTEIIRQVMRLMSLPGIKLCVSSRPEYYLKQRFCGYPQLKLHQLTERDIRLYTADILRDAPLPDSFEAIDERQLSHLQNMVVRKANGVFLWVHYALKSLIRGLLGGDNWQELADRLEQLPEKLIELYRHMWNRLNDDQAIYRTEAAAYFRFMLGWPSLTNGEPITVLKMTIVGNMTSLQRRVLELEEDLPLSKFLKLCQATENRLASRCAGLLEVNAHDDECFFSYQERHSPQERLQLQQYSRKYVSFIHRTAYDFLRETPDGKGIMSFERMTPTEFAIFIFRLYAIMQVLFEPVKHIEINVEMLIRTELGNRIRCLPPNMSKDMIHLLVRSCQRAMIAMGIECPLDGWNFPLVSFPAKDFIGKAAACGLSSFVRSFITEVGSGQLTKSYLNYLLLCSSDLQKSISWWSLYHDELALLHSLELIQGLLDKGADPTLHHYCHRPHDRTVYTYVTTSFRSFLVGSSTLITNFEHVPIWVRTLQKFVDAGVELGTTLPIVVGSRVASALISSLDQWEDMDGSSAVIEFNVADLLCILCRVLGVEAPVKRASREVSDRLPRVHYLRQTPEDPMNGDARPDQSQPGYWKVNAEDSAALVDLLTMYLEQVMAEPGDGYGRRWKWKKIVEPKLPGIIERSERIDDVEEIYKDFAERGWVADPTYDTDPGEAFETKTSHELIETRQPEKATSEGSSKEEGHIM